MEITSRKKVLKTKKIVAVKNSRQALIRKVAQAPTFPSRRHLQIQDLVYSTAPELQSLAFKAGFNLGAEVYRESDGSILSLEHVLENAGLGKIVYYPFESHSVLTSRSVKSNGIDLGTNVHVFEAGIISGYLSAHMKKNIVVKEQTCVFNGASACEFMATAGTVENIEHKPLEFTNVLRTLLKVIPEEKTPEMNNAYYALAIKPLTSEPVLSEATKFLYLTGKMLAQNLPDFKRSVVGAANLLGIQKTEVTNDKKKGVFVDLDFAHGTSANSFVDFSVAMLAGIMKGKFGRNVSVRKSKDRKGFYKVRLQVVSTLAK